MLLKKTVVIILENRTTLNVYCGEKIFFQPDINNKNLLNYVYEQVDDE